MQIKTRNRHYIPIRMDETKEHKSENTKCWWECGTTTTLMYLWWQCNVAVILAPVWWFLRKSNTELTHDPAILPLGNYSTVFKTCIHTKTCTQSNFMHSHQNLRTTKVASDRWMDKQIGIHTLNGILVSNEKEQALIHRATWMNPKCIFQSERRQTKKVTCFVISLVRLSRKGKTTGTGNRSVVTRGLEGGAVWPGEA